MSITTDAYKSKLIVIVFKDNKMWSNEMKIRNQYFSKLQFFTLILMLFVGMNTAEAAACTNNNWQPTFVHDLDNPYGPWYVLPNRQFIKLRIVNNSDWTPHACDLIKRSGVRDRRGYTNCQQYTRVQCGCQRGVSEGNSMCASFLARHNNRIPVLSYETATTRPAQPPVVRPSNPVMRHNRCTCEDWNNDGRFGVVLGRKVLRSNYGTYAQCMNHADTLKECTGPDVIRHSNTVMKGGIDARIEGIDQCRYASGGRPSERSHYNCKVTFSLQNTSNIRIRMTSGWYEMQDLLGKTKRGRLNYSYLNPGQKKTSKFDCTIAHGRQRGTLIIGGTGYHYLEKPTPNKDQFSWRLDKSCP